MNEELKHGEGICVGDRSGFFTNTYIFLSFKQEIKLSNTLFKIENLKELTLYCFRIQVVLKVYPDLQLLGLPSVPECYRTTISGMN